MPARYSYPVVASDPSQQALKSKVITATAFIKRQWRRRQKRAKRESKRGKGPGNKGRQELSQDGKGKMKTEKNSWRRGKADKDWEKRDTDKVFSFQMSVSIESTFILLFSSSASFSVSLQQNCNSVRRNALLPCGTESCWLYTSL